MPKYNMNAQISIIVLGLCFYNLNVTHSLNFPGVYIVMKTTFHLHLATGASSFEY
jgi:hypothetical protein